MISNSNLFSLFIGSIFLFLITNQLPNEHRLLSSRNAAAAAASSEHVFNKTNEHDDDESFVVVDLSEFVARVKGGTKQAERIAKKFNLKLVKQVRLLEKNFFQ